MEQNTPVTVLVDCPLETFLQDETVIEGGHYVIGEPIDSVGEWTWEKAVELYSNAIMRGLKNIGLMLLIEDFAVETSARDQYRSDYRLPLAYQNSLDRHQVESGDVTVVWEVQLRNRARGDLRRRLKPRISWQDDGYFLRSDQSVNRRVTQGTIPVCNLIMARHIAEKDRRYRHSLNLYDIKWECQSGGGVAVSRSLYDTTITVYNAYVTSS